MIHQRETVLYTAISPCQHRWVFNSSGPFVLFINQFCNKNIGIIYLAKTLYFTYGRFVKQEQNSRLVKRQEMGGMIKHHEMITLIIKIVTMIHQPQFALILRDPHLICDET